ncbi:hypothetical protein Hanom_Chr14g01302861 [Helianthus anomalus]
MSSVPVPKIAKCSSPSPEVRLAPLITMGRCTQGARVSLGPRRLERYNFYKKGVQYKLEHGVDLQNLEYSCAWVLMRALCVFFNCYEKLTYFLCTRRKLFTWNYVRFVA